MLQEGRRHLALRRRRQHALRPQRCRKQQAALPVPKSAGALLGALAMGAFDGARRISFTQGGQLDPPPPRPPLPPTPNRNSGSKHAGYAGHVGNHTRLGPERDGVGDGLHRVRVPPDEEAAKEHAPQAVRRRHLARDLRGQACAACPGGAELDRAPVAAAPSDPQGVVRAQRAGRGMMWKPCTGGAGAARGAPPGRCCRRPCGRATARCPLGCSLPGSCQLRSMCTAAVAGSAPGQKPSSAQSRVRQSVCKCMCLD